MSKLKFISLSNLKFFWETIQNLLMKNDGSNLVEDKPLATPTLTANWTVSGNGASETKTGASITVEVGQTVNAEVSFSYDLSSGTKKAPTSINKSVYGGSAEAITPIPSENTNTSIGTVPSDTQSGKASRTIKVTFNAVKKGLQAVNNIIKYVSGETVSESKSVTCNHYYRVFWGGASALPFVTGSTTELDYAQLKNLFNNDLKGAKGITLNGSTTTGQRYYYMFPASYSALTKLYEGGNAVNTLDAYTRKEFTVKSPFASTGVAYYVYESNNPDIYSTTKELVFS